MSDYAAAQLLYVGLDERERGPADELPALAAASLVTAAALCGTDTEAVPHLLQVGGGARPFGKASLPLLPFKHIFSSWGSSLYYFVT